MFDHEKLQVYQMSLRLLALVDDLVKNLPRGRSYLGDQFQRAALSVSLNVAEGAGEYAIAEKSRFYRMAKRSATECAGLFDACKELGLVEKGQYSQGRELLINVVSILIKMAKRSEEVG